VTPASGVGALLASGTLTLDTIERDAAVHTDIPGGSALYGAAAARLVLPTMLVGTVGEDFPFDALQPLWERGVDRSMVEVLHGRTFRWHARYTDEGDQRVTLSRDRGVADGRLPPVDPPTAMDYALFLGSTDPRIQRFVREACADARIAGLDSMRHWWSEHAQSLHELLPRVHVLFVDEDELQLAVGAPDERSSVARLHECGPDVVVVKRGSRGAWLSRRGSEPLTTRAVSLATAIDATGAGDAFGGALIAALAKWPERGDAFALRFATAVASFAVEGVGTATLTNASLPDVEARMQGLDIATS